MEENKYLNCFDCCSAYITYRPEVDLWQLYCSKADVFCGYNNGEAYGCKDGEPQFTKKPDFTNHTGQGDYTN